MRDLAQRRNLVFRFPRFSLIRNGGDRLEDDEINGDDDVSNDDDDDDNDDDDDEEDDHYMR